MNCVGEIPHLKAAVSRLKDKPFEILAISLDDSREALAQTLKAFKPPGIHTWDEAGRENPVAKRYNVIGLPRWYLIGPDGVIRARDPFGDKLVPAVEAALAAAKSPPASGE